VPRARRRCRLVAAPLSPHLGAWEERAAISYRLPLTAALAGRCSYGWIQTSTGRRAGKNDAVDFQATNYQHHDGQDFEHFFTHNSSQDTATGGLPPAPCLIWALFHAGLLMHASTLIKLPVYLPPILPLPSHTSSLVASKDDYMQTALPPSHGWWPWTSLSEGPDKYMLYFCHMPTWRTFPSPDAWGRVSWHRPKPPTRCHFIAPPRDAAAVSSSLSCALISLCAARTRITAIRALLATRPDCFGVMRRRHLYARMPPLLPRVQTATNSRDRHDTILLVRHRHRPGLLSAVFARTGLLPLQGQARARLPAWAAYARRTRGPSS